MRPITRFPGSVAGRSSVVVHDGLVFTVATADTYDLDMPKQAAEALANLDAQLALAGTDKSRLLSCVVYITDMALKPQMNAIWDGWVDMANPPQRACIGAALEDGDLIEIVAVASTKD
jgi:enamine deaminase RidA (YjgF/YER057c/UK114 family)